MCRAVGAGSLNFENPKLELCFRVLRDSWLREGAA